MRSTAAGARLGPVRTAPPWCGPGGRRRTSRARSPRLMYLIPTYQNPTGGVMAEHRRRQLAGSSKQHQVTLIDDESLSGRCDFRRRPRRRSRPSRQRADSDGRLAQQALLGRAARRLGARVRPVIAQLGRLKAVADLGGSLPGQVIASRLLAAYDEIRLDRRRVIAQRSSWSARLLAATAARLVVGAPAGRSVLVGPAAARQRHGVRPGGAACTASRWWPARWRRPTAASATSCGCRSATGRAMLEEGVRRLARAWQAYAPSEEPHARSLAVIVSRLVNEVCFSSTKAASRERSRFSCKKSASLKESASLQRRSSCTSRRDEPTRQQACVASSRRWAMTGRRSRQSRHTPPEVGWR